MDPHSHILARSPQPWDRVLPTGRYFLVADVHAGSIAHAAGVTPGMFVTSFGGGWLPADWDMLEARAWTGETETTLLDPHRGETIQLVTRGFPWGMRLDTPIASLCDEIRGGFGDATLMAYRILNAPPDDYRQIVDAAATAIRRPTLSKRLALLTVAIALFVRRRKDMAVRDIDDPLRTAASLHALLQGDVDRAAKILPEKTRALIHGLGTSVAALYHYATAMVAEANGESRERVVELLMDAAYQVPESTLLKRKFVELGIAAPSARSRVLRPFPLAYDLPANDPLKSKPSSASERVRLQDALSQLMLHQVGVVIALGCYRTNRPYDDLMRNFAYLYPLIRDRIGFVHVITSEVELRNPAWNEGWRGAEKYAQSNGVPLQILTDETDGVADALQLTKSPWMLLLSRDGTMLSEGSDSDDGAFWQAFGELGRPSLQDKLH